MDQAALFLCSIVNTFLGFKSRDTAFYISSIGQIYVCFRFDLEDLSQHSNVLAIRDFIQVLKCRTAFKVLDFLRLFKNGATWLRDLIF